MSFDISKSIFAAATAFTLVAGSAAAENWRAWNIHHDGHPNTAAMDRFAELVAEKTDGEVTVDVFHGGVLGSQPDALEQVYGVQLVRETKRDHDGDEDDDDLRPRFDVRWQ